MSELVARFGREFRTGDVLFREGERGDVLYVIQTGSVRISKRVGDDEQTIALLGPGEFFGEMAILNDKPRTATATALVDARCLELDAKRFETMVANHAEVALRLIKKLAKRLDSADALLEILMHKDPRARIMLGLSRHAESFGEKTDTGIRLRIGTEELAKEVGVEVELVREVVAQLSRLRLATEDANGRLVVADVDRLQDFVEFLEMPQRFVDAAPVR